MAERCETCGQWLPGDRPHTCGEPNPRPPKIWPPERVARLLELNAAGMSTADIAADLGCTKSMVVGKLFRELGSKPKPWPPRPPKPPARPIPATLTNPCVEITDPSPDQLAQWPKPPPLPRPPKPPAPPPAAERPPPLPRRVVGQRFAANGMLTRIKEKQASHKPLSPADAASIATPVQPAAKPVTIYDLTGNTCRWPLWLDDCRVVDDQHYCGAPAIEIGRYCAKHSAAAYNKSRS